MLGHRRENEKLMLRGARFLRLRMTPMPTGYFFTVIGLVLFIEGLPYLAFPAQAKAWLRKLTELPVFHLRFMGGMLMVVGLLLVYWGRRHGG